MLPPPVSPLSSPVLALSLDPRPSTREPRRRLRSRTGRLFSGGPIDERKASPTMNRHFRWQGFGPAPQPNQRELYCAAAAQPRHQSQTEATQYDHAFNGRPPQNYNASFPVISLQQQQYEPESQQYVSHATTGQSPPLARREPAAARCSLQPLSLSPPLCARLHVVAVVLPPPPRPIHTCSSPPGLLPPAILARGLCPSHDRPHCRGRARPTWPRQARPRAPPQARQAGLLPASGLSRSCRTSCRR